MKKHTIGINFDDQGAESVLLCENGEVFSKTVIEYSLNDGLLHPMELLNVLTRAVSVLLQNSGVDKDAVSGLGIAFPSGHPLPVMKDGTPLSFFREYNQVPEALISFNKSAQSRALAAFINNKALSSHEAFFSNHPYGVDSDSSLVRLLDIFNSNNSVFTTCDHFVETADWLTWQLAGSGSINSYAASKALFDGPGDLPDAEFLKGLAAGFENVIEKFYSFPVSEVGSCAGRILPFVAKTLGLSENTMIASAVDPLAAGIAAYGAASDGNAFLSNARDKIIVLSDREIAGTGLAYSRDSIAPGLFGYIGPLSLSEVSLPSFVNADKGLLDEALKLPAGGSGVIVTDQVIAGVDTDTTAAGLLRAHIETRLFSLRSVIKELQNTGLSLNSLAYIYDPDSSLGISDELVANVLGIRVSRLHSDKAELGAAILAFEAGGDPAAVSSLSAGITYAEPDKDIRLIYDKLYKEYKNLSAHFSFGADDICERLRGIKESSALLQPAPSVSEKLTREFFAWPGSVDDAEYEEAAPTLESEFGIKDDNTEDSDDIKEDYSPEVRAAAEAAAKELFEAVDAVAGVRNDAEVYAAFRELIEEEAGRHTEEIISAAKEVADAALDAEIYAGFKDLIEEEAERHTNEIIKAAEDVANVINDAEVYAVFKDIIEEEAEKSTNEIIKAAEEVAMIGAVSDI